MYYKYMLRCQDNSIYTGITVDIKRRMKEHFSKDKNCAKYTKKHTAIKLEKVWESEDRKLASKLEYHIKKLSKDKKEELITNSKGLEKYLSKKIDFLEYKIVDLKAVIGEIKYEDQYNL